MPSAPVMAKFGSMATIILSRQQVLLVSNDDHFLILLEPFHYFHNCFFSTILTNFYFLLSKIFHNYHGVLGFWGFGVR